MDQPIKYFSYFYLVPEDGTPNFFEVQVRQVLEQQNKELQVS